MYCNTLSFWREIQNCIDVKHMQNISFFRVVVLLIVPARQIFLVD